jgi:hypothetical protein
MSITIKKATQPGLLPGLSPINYKDYPECMFAVISAYLSPDEASEVRKAAGKVVFRHTDKNGSTYKNGLLHSYDDKPAVNRLSIHGKIMEEWYKDGLLHREGGLHAVNYGGSRQWWVNGKKHREGGLHAIEIHFFGNLSQQEWWVDGNRHRDGDLPAFTSNITREIRYYKNGLLHREGNQPAWIDYRFGKEYFYQNGEEFTKEGVSLSKKETESKKPTTSKKETASKKPTVSEKVATSKKVTASKTQTTSKKATTSKKETASEKLKETVEPPVQSSRPGVVTRSQTRAKKLM